MRVREGALLKLVGGQAMREGRIGDETVHACGESVSVDGGAVLL